MLDASAFDRIRHQLLHISCTRIRRQTRPFGACKNTPSSCSSSTFTSRTRTTAMPLRRPASFELSWPFAALPSFELWPSPNAVERLRPSSSLPQRRSCASFCVAHCALPFFHHRESHRGASQGAHVGLQQNPAAEIAPSPASPVACVVVPAVAPEPTDRGRWHLVWSRVTSDSKPCVAPVKVTKVRNCMTFQIGSQDSRVGLSTSKGIAR